MEKNYQSDGGTGYLSVSVRTANGAIPLEGALVTLRRGTPELPDAGGGDIIASFRSDRSGMTPRIFLPAPPRAQSQEPGFGRPYALYSVDVSLDGYYSNTYADIPVFDGITSVQTVTLVPLPEDGAGGSSVPDDVIGYGGRRENVLTDGNPDREGEGSGSLSPDGERKPEGDAQ